MFTATRNGTDRGKLDAKWVDDNGTTVICTAATPKRNNTPSGQEDQSPFFSTYSTDLDGDATTGECKLIINLYDLSFTNSSGTSLKDYGFCNITIEGIMTEPETIKGDVNNDGVVNGTDIQAIINLIVEGEYDQKGDINKDGNVNGTDIQEVINIIITAD